MNNNNNQITDILKRLNLLEENQNNNIPQFEIQLCGEIHIEAEVEEKDKCCICLEELDDDKNLVVFECGHKLNFTCFIQLMNSNRFNVKCPLCRVQINTRNRPRRDLNMRIMVDSDSDTDEPEPIQRASGRVINLNNRVERRIIRQYNFTDEQEERRIQLNMSRFNFNILINNERLDIEQQQQRHDEQLVRRERIVDAVNRRRLRQDLRNVRRDQVRHRRVLGNWRRNSCKWLIMRFLLNNRNFYSTQHIRDNLGREFTDNTYRISMNTLLTENWIQTSSTGNGINYGYNANRN